MTVTNLHIFLLSSKQAQQALCIGSTTLYKLCAEGKLSPVRFGQRCTRFRVSEIQALIDSHKSPASKAVSHE